MVDTYRRYLSELYKVHTLYLTYSGFRDLLLSSGILLDATKFLKILSIRFSWLTEKLKIPSLFKLFFPNYYMSLRRFSVLSD